MDLVSASETVPAPSRAAQYVGMFDPDPIGAKEMASVRITIIQQGLGTSRPGLSHFGGSGGRYDLWNVTDIVDGEGAGVMSVSLMVLPLELRTKVFSRATLPSLLYVTFRVWGPSCFAVIVCVPVMVVGVPSSLQVIGLSLSVSLKSILSPFIWMASTPVSCDSLMAVSFHVPDKPGPPEIRLDVAVMVYGLPSDGVMSRVRMIFFPSADTSIFTLLIGLPSRVFSNSYPAADLLQVVVTPFACALGLPSQTTLGLVFPPRVTVKPSASVPIEKVGPAYLSVERSIFQEPFHGLCCATQGRVRATNDTRAHALMPYCFVMISSKNRFAEFGFGGI